MGTPTQDPLSQKSQKPEPMPEPTDSASPRSWRASIGQAGRYLGQSLRLMVGLPDYDAYLNHMERTHPDQAPMSYEAFFQERLEARYGSRTGKCC